MAKNKEGDAVEAPKPDGAAEKTTPKEKKPREPKAKEGGKEKGPNKEKTSPTAPPGEKPVSDATPSTGDGAAAPAAATGSSAPPTSTKKKGRRPGIAPHRGKKLRNQMKNHEQKLSKEGIVPLKRAITLLKQMKRAKFDETIEVHMSLGVDITQSDQIVRGTVSLPNGIGKSVRVLVFCQGDNVARAKEAGADFAGADEIIEKIQKEGWTEFDVALATQDLMGKVSRLGKVLGPRGLMPTPKAGTVITGDVASSVREFKAGKVEYRTDKGGNVHAGVGKMSFDEDKLVQNVTAFVEQIRAAKPAGVKGNYVKSITVSATMSPGIPVTM